MAASISIIIKMYADTLMRKKISKAVLTWENVTWVIFCRHTLNISYESKQLSMLAETN